MYSVVQTETFKRWINSLKDPIVRMRVALRIDQIEKGNFGDHHAVGDGISELRFHMAQD